MSISDPDIGTTTPSEVGWVAFASELSEVTRSTADGHLSQLLETARSVLGARSAVLLLNPAPLQWQTVVAVGQPVAELEIGVTEQLQVALSESGVSLWGADQNRPVASAGIARMVCAPVTVSRAERGLLVALCDGLCRDVNALDVDLFEAIADQAGLFMATTRAGEVLAQLEARLRNAG